MLFNPLKDYFTQIICIIRDWIVMAWNAQNESTTNHSFKLKVAAISWNNKWIFCNHKNNFMFWMWFKVLLFQCRNSCFVSELIPNQDHFSKPYYPTLTFFCFLQNCSLIAWIKRSHSSSILYNRAAVQFCQGKSHQQVNKQDNKSDRYSPTFGTWQLSHLVLWTHFALNQKSRC